MWRSAIITTVIVSRLAEAGSAVDELALHPFTDAWASTRLVHAGETADGPFHRLSELWHPDAPSPREPVHPIGRVPVRAPLAAGVDPDE